MRCCREAGAGPPAPSATRSLPATPPSRFTCEATPKSGPSSATFAAKASQQRSVSGWHKHTQTNIQHTHTHNTQTLREALRLIRSAWREGRDWNWNWRGGGGRRAKNS